MSTLDGLALGGETVDIASTELVRLEHLKYTPGGCILSRRIESRAGCSPQH